MLARILTAAVLIPAVIALVWWGPLPVLAAAAAVVCVLALVEFFRLGERMGLHGFQKWTIACTAGLFYAQYSTGLIEKHVLAGGLSLIRDAVAGTLSLEAVFLIFVFGAAAIALGTRRPLHEILPAIAVSSAGLLFVALPFSYLVRISEVERTGRQLVLLTLSMMWAGDTFAYFVGRSLGHLPMAPALSPKKTWEGALANLVGSLLVAAFFAHWMRVDALALLILAGLANIAGQVGDLTKSAYKRGAAVKDSGTLLPGHGGVLDRIDSLTLAAPVVWIVQQWLAMR